MKKLKNLVTLHILEHFCNLYNLLSIITFKSSSISILSSVNLAVSLIASHRKSERAWRTKSKERKELTTCLDRYKKEIWKKRNFKRNEFYTCFGIFLP